MEPKQFVTRRRALMAMAPAVGGILISDGVTLSAASVEPQSNDHFWYRLAPAGPYIDSQRDNKAFGFDDEGKIFLSEDNAKTWPHSAAFPNSKNITFSCIQKDGNIVFATRAKLYLASDNLKTVEQITVKDLDGSDYIPHTPKDPELPGWYFHSLDGVHTWDVKGTEMMVWGNYCNVRGGSVPVNIYYSTDQGKTVKIAYGFGQNPSFMDKGANRKAAEGTLLGHADNPVICRHIHCVAYNPVENAFYACTGDVDRPDNKRRHECHWLRGVYDAKADKWEWKVIVSSNSNSRFKTGGVNFVDGKLYWAADANGVKLPNQKHDRGIFRCDDPADLPNKEKHTLLFNPEYESANMIIQEDTILAAHYATASPYTNGFIISNDMGKTWAQYDLEGFGKRSGVRFQKKNSEGWFRVDLRKGWIERGEVMFIKPK